ncbi:MAG: DUF6145 family protein [Eubacterium sp.]|nr:DUF6145 family protein [Eubacterium sp.]SEG35712.1 hypothetical protein SAMN04487934_11737 [Eubacterium ruminantium]
MYQEDVILCSASRYTKKFYLNPDFKNLPQEIQKDLKIMCVLFTEDVGGIILLMFDSEGNLRLVTNAEEDDILYDEIGSELKIKQLQNTKRELFEQLEEYYKTFFM